MDDFLRGYSLKVLGAWTGARVAFPAQSAGAEPWSGAFDHAAPTWTPASRPFSLHRRSCRSKRLPLPMRKPPRLLGRRPYQTAAVPRLHRPPPQPPSPARPSPHVTPRPHILPVPSTPKFAPSPRLTAAFEYACQLHANQLRKGATIPYIAHLMAVAALVMEHGGGEDEAMAACCTMPLRIRTTTGRFRERSARGLGRKCSRSSRPVPTQRGRTSHPGGSARQRMWPIYGPRHRAYVFISAADKLHNARAILEDYRRLGDELWERFNTGREDSCGYYSDLVTAFRRP